MDIFTYRDAASFLADCLTEKKAKNPRFSLRAWAKQLGHKTPSLLSDVVNGKRSIHRTLAIQLAEHLSLTLLERKYFQLLVLKSAAKKAHRASYDELLAQWRPQKIQREIDLDGYHLIADWRHSAILEMFALKDRPITALSISRRLGGESVQATIETALGRLQRVGLITLDECGDLQRCKDHVHVEAKTSNDAIRRHHSQMIAKAQEALEQQAVDQRHFFGTTLAIRKISYPKAAALIERFHAEIRELSCDAGADEVYRFNTQFFKLTTAADPNGSEHK